MSIIEIDEVGKIGGASLKNARAIEDLVCRTVKENQGTKFNIVSAFSGMTNDFEHLVLYMHASREQEAVAALNKISKFHYEIVSELFPSKRHAVYKEVEDLLSIHIYDSLGKPYEYLYSQHVGRGELLSAVIINDYFKFRGFKSKLVDSRSYIVTSNITSSKILLDETVERLHDALEAGQILQKNYLHWAPGFIGVTLQGQESTLLREGSDDSAVAYAIGLGAEFVKFFKKRGVPGCPNELSHEQFRRIEENSGDGKLLSPSSLEMLIKYKINFSIVYVDNPEITTVIYA